MSDLYQALLKKVSVGPVVTDILTGIQTKNLSTFFNRANIDVKTIQIKFKYLLGQNKTFKTFNTNINK